jgi:hypothetical protein
MYRKMFSPFTVVEPFRLLWKAFVAAGVGKEACIVLILLISLQIIDDIIVEKGDSTQQSVAKLPIPLRWICYLAIIMMIIIYASSREAVFIYFQF